MTEPEPTPVATPSRRFPRWGVTAGVLGLAVVVLGALFLQADRERRDQRRRVAELTSANEELRRQQEALTARLGDAERDLTAERTRFTAVEPCLRQVADPQPLTPLGDEEVDRILREATRKLPRNPSGPFVTSIEVPAKDLLPACRDVEKQLR